MNKDVEMRPNSPALAGTHRQVFGNRRLSYQKEFAGAKKKRCGRRSIKSEKMTLAV
jgi:hypothetical protein